MSKKKNKKSNPHSAPQPKAKSTQPAKKSNPLVWGIGAIVVVAILIIAAVVLTQKPSTTSGAQSSANPTATTSADTYTPPALEEDVTYTARIDVKGNGTGGSEHEIVGEFSSNGWDNPLSHKRGTISMARSNDPNSASSQFFIVHEDSTFLDPDYAAFGTVTEGMDVVDAICKDAQPTDGNGTIPASEQPVINSVTILTNK